MYGNTIEPTSSVCWQMMESYMVKLSEYKEEKVITEKHVLGRN